MKKLIISIIILVMLSSSVLGFGVTDWFSGPIVIAPGGTTEVPLELQNMIGNEDLIVKVDIKEGNDLVTIKEGIEIDVPLNVKKRISVIVKVPENYTEGDYPVNIEFVTVTPKGEGQVQIGTGVTKIFSVSVNKGTPIESKGESSIKNIGWITVLVILAILIIIMIIVKFIGKKKR